MERWSRERAGAWWQAQPWLMGANYVPSNAVNDVEMWMKDTFDPELIRRELTWAAQAGMNTMRVFLSYHVWLNERQAFLDTFESFLRIADECGHVVLPILFDDCAFDSGADPVYGRQPDPIPCVHNSRWVPSPGLKVQYDPEQRPSCREYLRDVIGAHRDDARIVAWDLYNEPGNCQRGLRCLPLLVEAFAWARELEPVQPLTSGIWAYGEEWLGLNMVIAALSDVINLHAYCAPDETQRLVEEAMARSGRPVIVTEWMHRPNGSTIMDLLPYYAQRRIPVWQWGLVNGRTQTHLNWDTWKNPDGQPEVWQHDILLADGTPYMAEEIELMRRLSSRG